MSGQLDKARTPAMPGLTPAHAVAGAGSAGMGTASSRAAVHRTSLHRQRRYSRAFFFAGMVGSRTASWLALL